MTCALPPLDQSVVEVGRGYGLGYNRERTSRDQLHGGMDFVASSGTPVLAPIPGVVDFVTRNDGPRISADAARGGASGQVRRMGGYGNAVVVRHDFAVPGLPTPFWTSYNHLSAVAAGIAPGVEVATGQLLGNVGSTTNGQFPGMGSHLHMEVRRAAFPGPVGRDSYELDTVDPYVLFQALGIDWLDFRREVERNVGGHLLVRADGPSGPTTCPGVGVRGLEVAIPTGRAHHRAPFPYIPGVGIPGVPFFGLEGIVAYMDPAMPDPLRGLSELRGIPGLGVVPSGYVDPATIKSKYTRYGTTQTPRPGSPAADVMPPAYDADAGASSSSSGSSSGLVIGVGAAALIVAAKFLRRT